LRTQQQTAHCLHMGTKSCNRLYGPSIRTAAERAAAARREADISPEMTVTNGRSRALLS